MFVDGQPAVFFQHLRGGSFSGSAQMSEFYFHTAPNSRFIWGGYAGLLDLQVSKRCFPPG